nr:hypothetical protein GCM10020092_075400 [Actinoplanes digitatis]
MAPSPAVRTYVPFAMMPGMLAKVPSGTAVEGGDPSSAYSAGVRWNGTPPTTRLIAPFGSRSTELSGLPGGGPSSAMLLYRTGMYVFSSPQVSLPILP